MLRNEDDVFSSTEPAVVDFELLEASKENVQPLASGRRVTALSALLATPHGQRDAKLSATRNRLRINIDIALDDEDDDPLEAYSQLVHWTMENYPQGHSVDSGLIELLEEATRVLKDHGNGKWRGEMKYLKLWLLYTSHVERPTIIYQFLLANEIGTRHALLYEEYAAVLERDGRRKDADEIYVLGINRRAQPLEHLKARHKEFQIRMMVLPPVEAEPAQRDATSSMSRQSGQASKRTILGQSSQSKSRTTAPLSSKRTVPSSSLPNGRFNVFTDAEESSDSAFSTNAYPDAGTRMGRIKENRQEKKPMSGATLKQKGKSRRAAIAAAPSSIIPYEDPEPEEDHPSSGPEESAAGFTIFEDEEGEGPDEPISSDSSVREDYVPLTPRTPGLGARTVRSDSQAAHSSEAEALRQDPLKNYDI